MTGPTNATDALRAILSPGGDPRTAQSVAGYSLRASWFAAEAPPSSETANARSGVATVRQVPPTGLRDTNPPSAVVSEDTHNGSPCQDTSAAVGFLAEVTQGWNPDWFVNLCAIPAERGAPAGQSWRVRDLPATQPEIAAWIERQGRAGHNLYFTANPLRRAVDAKPKREDIAAVVVVHVDMDPPVTEASGYAEARRMVLAAAEVLGRANAAPRPTCVIDTGNGLGVFYQLAQPVLPAEQAAENPATAFAQVEAVTREAHAALGRLHGLKVDGTHNADRLMRLPGTRNFPSRAKLGKGYPAAPSLACVLHQNTAARVTADEMRNAAAGWEAEADAKGRARGARQDTGAGTTAPTGGGGAAAGADQDKQIEAATEALLRKWGTVTSAGDPDDLPADLLERLTVAALMSRTLPRRLNGKGDGLGDPSGSGMLMSMVGSLKAAGFDLIDMARGVWAHQNAYLLAKHPDARAQARDIARAWVRSAAQPPQDAAARAAREAGARAAREAARAVLAAASLDPALVNEILATCTPGDAAADAEADRAMDAWVRRSGLSRSVIKGTRKRAIEAGARARRTAELEAAAAGRPIIDRDDNLEAVLAQAEAALAAAVPPVLFRMGDMLCEVAERHGPAPTAGASGAPNRQPEGPVAIHATKLVVWHALSRVAVFVSRGRPAGAPQDVAGVIHDRGPAVAVPQLRALVAHPVLRADGSVATMSGYDPDTGAYLTEDWSGLALPAQPDQNDAQPAADILLEPFCDFPFADDTCKAAFLAHVLTLFTRHLIPVSPAFVYSAPTAGSGKTRLASAPSRIAHGRGPDMLQAVVGRGADEETRKQITALLRGGRSDVLMDNLTRGATFGSRALDALLTTPTWGDRVLGESSNIRLPNTLTLAATGNNLVVAEDTARRAVFAYLEPDVARPETRQNFVFPDLDAHLRDERPRFVAAALTLLRAHILHNRPFAPGGKPPVPLGSFEDWARVVAGAVEWVGLSNPILSQGWWRDRMGGAEEADALGALLEALDAVFGTGRFTTAAVIDARGGDGPGGQDVPSVQSAALGAAIDAVVPGWGGGGGADAKRLGRYLSASLNKPTDAGFRLRRAGTVQGTTHFVLERCLLPAREVAQAAGGIDGQGTVAG